MADKRAQAVLVQLTEKLRNAFAYKTPLGFPIKFDLGDEGVIHVEGSANPMEVTNEDKPAETTFGVSPEDLSAMIDGDLPPMSAFMSGKLRVDGDMTKAMQVSGLFS
ncbi:MAG: SCP2 sterol-binding domain-containing protein [Gammaproteobacteria bacterium]